MALIHPQHSLLSAITKTHLLPTSTGHIVGPNINGGGRESDWRADKGKFGNDSLSLSSVSCIYLAAVFDQFQNLKFICCISKLLQLHLATQHLSRQKFLVETTTPEGDAYFGT